MNNSMKSYYLIVGNQQYGPYSLEELQVGLRAGWARREQLVWTPGWIAWTPIFQVPGLGAPIPPPHPNAPQISNSLPQGSSPPPQRKSRVWIGCLPFILLGVIIAGSVAIWMDWVQIPFPGGVLFDVEVATPSNEPVPPWMEEARNDALAGPARYVDVLDGGQQ